MVHQLLTPPQEVRTDRLVLTPVTPSDVDDLFVVFSDPRTWTHLPSGRHTERADTEHLVQRDIGSRIRHGVGAWAVRSAGGAFLGYGGVTMLGAGVWNLGYRLAPSAWGNGYATELARAAVRAAHDAEPDVPVTGRVLTNNPASARVLERVGLSLVWQGTTAADAGTGVERQVWSDRRLTGAPRDWLVANA